MTRLTRRSVLKAGVSAAGAAALAGRARAVAQPPTVRRRFGATTPQGKAMLAKYAKAVGLMKDETKFPPSDPRSWKFQWYTHWIPGPIGGNWQQVVAAKAKMINQVFVGKPTTDPGRLLAEAMWDTCQSHDTNANDPNFFQALYFCVWHRHYLYFFEEIIRAVLADDTFTLPYWNYSSGNVADLSLPPEFLDPKSPLFQPNRNPWVNKGDRIDRQNPGVLRLAALSEPDYIDTPDGSIGFCPSLDANPHGQVHVLVGTPLNMGDVPTAANDPIFWIHHCNIDRLWESWNRIPGRTNPSWPNRSFAFANGQGSAVSVQPAGADRTSTLKYDYDTYVKPPGLPGGPSPTLAAGPAPKVTRAFAQQAVALGDDRIDIALTPAIASGPGGGPATLSAPNRRMYLTLGGLTAPSALASTYNVFLDLPAAVTAPTPEDPFYAGTIHFFGVGPEAHGPDGHRFSFNVTQLIRTLTEKKAVTTTPRVTLVRHGDPEGEKPTIGQILLTEL